MTFRILAMLTAVMLFAGCASNPMQLNPNQQISHTTAETAQVVFMRDSIVGSAISASLFDVTNGQLTFIGVLDNGTKVAYQTTPGKHVFMVVSEAADFMEADLSGGRNYFGLSTPRMGFWKARFSLWPIKKDPAAAYRIDSKDFKEWLDDTKLYKISPKAQIWFESNKADIREKYDEYWPVWQKKSAADKAKRTLTPADGI